MYSLVKEIINAPWAIERSAAERLMPLVGSILFPGQFPAPKSEAHVDPKSTKLDVLVIDAEGKSHFAFNARKGGYSSNTGSQEKVVMVIPIKDVILKYDQDCGPVGMETISNIIKNAANDPNVAAIVLDIDSPGGSAGATQNPYNSIIEARKSKPVLAYVGNGMAASAAYYIASAADAIYSTYNTDSAGSIGTMVTLEDWSGFFEKHGIKIHEIYASKSTEKNKDFRDALAGDHTAIIEGWLDPFNEQFHKDVIAGRNGKLNKKALKGGMYFAPEAIEMGLIDGMKSLNEVIAEAFEESDRRSTNQTNQMSMFNKFPKAKVLADNKKAGLENSAEQILAAQQELLELTGMHLNVRSEESIETDAEQAASDEMATLNSTITEQATTIQTLGGQVSSLQAQVTELGGQSSAAAVVTTEAEAEGDKSAAGHVFDDAAYAKRRMEELGMN